MPAVAHLGHQLAALGDQVEPRPGVQGSTLRGVEQVPTGEVAQHPEAAADEIQPRHGGVLLGDLGDVARVRVRWGPEDGQVGVAEQLAVGVARAGHVGGGQPDQPGDLVQVLHLQAGTAELSHAEAGRALLVGELAERDVVDGVVVERGQPDQEQVVGIGGELVDVSEHRGQVLGAVVAPVRLGVPSDHPSPGLDLVHQGGVPDGLQVSSGLLVGPECVASGPWCVASGHRVLVHVLGRSGSGAGCRTAAQRPTGAASRRDPGPRPAGAR